ncbi:MAG TPA: ATP-binding protein, partial [Chroococcidiopsis sp.]
QTHCPTPAADVAEHMVGMNLDFITEDFEKILISMKTGAERIRQLVLSLRNFARLDESDMKFVDIHEGIENTLTMLQHQLNGEANRAKIEIIKEYSHLPVVECYPGQLNQVILYLLSNAIDALEDGIGDQITPANGEWIAPTIRICTQVLDQHQVEIRIADNGRGIPESLQQRLFDPFFTTKSVGRGTGLGLSISYQIVVKRHRGQLSCVSTLGAGAEFIIKIPILQSSSASVLTLSN